MMKKIYKERLLQVIRVLEELPAKKRFSLATWYKCGTVGCAIGWSAADPWFTRRGFRLSSVTDALYYNMKKVTHEPYYRGNTHWLAVNKFFGLHNKQASYLFEDCWYKKPTRRNVIFRIKKFIENERVKVYVS